MKFEDMINNVILGDCYEVIKNIPDKSIDCIYTDIPYLYSRGYHKHQNNCNVGIKQEFVDKANAIHHNKYDYSFVNYLNGQSKIMIVCKQCGNIFEQRANNHLSGSGCPNCN